jgi:hypothetical protein
MKPISDGSGPERYTLYFPIAFAERRGSIDFKIIGGAASKVVAREIEVIEHDQHFLILRVPEHTSDAQAIRSFKTLKRLCDALMLETDMPVFTYDALEPARDFPCAVSSSWPEAVSKGWSGANDTDSIELEQMVDIFFPCIVAEHKYIVKAGTMRGRITPRIEQEKIENAITLLNTKFDDKNERTQRKFDLAMNAYCAALNHDDPSWKYFCFVASLDALSEQEDNATELIDALETIGRELGPICDKFPEMPEIHAAAKIAKAAIEQKKKKTSVRQAFIELILQHQSEIMSALPQDHPARAEGLKKWAGLVYGLRSRVAHDGGWGEYIDEEKHRANQLVQIAAKTVLKLKLL